MLYTCMRIKCKNRLSKSWYALTGPFKPRSIFTVLRILMRFQLRIEDIFSIAPWKWSLHEMLKRGFSRLNKLESTFKYHIKQQPLVITNKLARTAIAHIIVARKTL